MGYDGKTGRMDWPDEFVWLLIAIGSGLLLTLLFDHYRRFPEASNLTVALLCCFAFYLLSILLRIQNQRGTILSGKPGVDERKLRYIFPVLGFGVGLALIFL